MRAIVESFVFESKERLLDDVDGLLGACCGAAGGRYACVLGPKGVLYQHGSDEGGHWVHRSNNAGGLTGGVTNGQPLVVRAAVKPISTLARPLPSADLITGESVDKAHYERSDIIVVPAAGVVGEAMAMLTLATFIIEKFGGDTMEDVATNLAAYRTRIARPLAMPVAGGGRGHGLSGTDEAGSGGDD